MRLGSVDIALLETIRIRLDTQPAAMLSLQDLIIGTNLTAEQLRKRFKSRYAVSIKQYNMTARMKYAGEQLLEGTPVKQLVITMGFVDHSHFNRAFKRAHGHSPSTFILNNSSPGP